MGNSLGRGKKTTKVMKVNGEIMKLKTPVYAGEVVKDYPGYVLLESEAVKHYGIRAKPLEFQQELKAKWLYFLVELPKFPEEKSARRVRSGINMSAKDRLESLMLARRSVSDLSILKPASITVEESRAEEAKENGGGVRLKMRLPRAEVEKLMMESKDEGEAAEKIMGLARAKQGNGAGVDGATAAAAPQSRINKGALVHRQERWNGSHGRIEGVLRTREKRVGFLPIHEGEILAVAS